jgi:hypothetical protein
MGLQIIESRRKANILKNTLNLETQKSKEEKRVSGSYIL